jgi:hypothetical protein
VDIFGREGERQRGRGGEWCPLSIISCKISSRQSSNAGIRIYFNLVISIIFSRHRLKLLSFVPMIEKVMVGQARGRYPGLSKG